jgi:hypothetical protein
MKIMTLQHIPLRSAYLCQDCDCVGNSSVQCPACASMVLMSLSSVLDREAPASERALTYTFPMALVGSSLAGGVNAELTEMVA